MSTSNLYLVLALIILVVGVVGAKAEDGIEIKYHCCNCCGRDVHCGSRGVLTSGQGASDLSYDLAKYNMSITKPQKNEDTSVGPLYHCCDCCGWDVHCGA